MGGGEYLGYNGFTDYNLASSSCIIVRQDNNTITTNTLPKSIQLYAVDEYFVPDSRGSPSITYHTINVNSRRYLYGAFFIFAILFTAYSGYTPVLTFRICDYDADNILTLNQSNLSPSHVGIVRSTTNTYLFINQPQQPIDYSQCVRWRLMEVAIKTRSDLDCPAIVQVLVFYVPDENSEYIPS